MAARPIYVEILVRAPLEELWTKTHQPELHQRWDLRFSRIEYLPQTNDAAPQRFLYATRLGLGLEAFASASTARARIASPS